MSHIHVPDGVLPLWLWLLGWAVTLTGVAVASRFASRDEDRRRVPLLAVLSALMLVAMSSEIIPIAYHVNLTVIAGVILGPALSIIAAFIVQLILALLGHGGITVLGLNALIVSCEMLIGWALFRAAMRILGDSRVRVAAFGVTVLTLALTTTVLVGIVALGGSEAGSRETGALDPGTLRFENPFAEGVFSLGLLGGDEHGHEDDEAHAEEEGHADAGLSIGRFAAVVYTLGPLGWILEGLLTAWVLGYVVRVRPDMLWKRREEQGPLRPVGDEGTVN